MELNGLVIKVKEVMGLFFLFVESIFFVKEGVFFGVVFELVSIGKLVVRKVKLIFEKKLVRDIFVDKMDMYIVVVNVFIVIKL